MKKPVQDKQQELATLKRKLAAAKRAHKRTGNRWSQIESIENQILRLNAV